MTLKSRSAATGFLAIDETINKPLEGVAHREMELAVTLEIGIQQGPMLLTACGIMGLHAHIDTHQEILEIEADTQSIGGSNLLIEFIELEHAALLLIILLDGPYIARIHKKTHFHNPEEFGPVLQIDIEADVTALIIEFGLGILIAIATWSQGADTPSSHTVGAATIKTFLEG